MRKSFEGLMVKELLQQRIANINFLIENKENIELLYTIVLETILNNKKLLICGNGESSGIADNLAGLFVSKFKNLKNPIKAISLNSNTSLITSIANDTSFDDIFKKQIENIGESGDTLIIFSASGTSRNIIEAIKQAKFQNIKTILITGNLKLNYSIDLEVNTFGEDFEQINEMHNIIAHIICELIGSNFNS
ncbi:MAG: SIS domain-containing protein [Candidatus Gastranaerophilales bacterium]|nr:SIS domain-containing protein [Candidatus Gastranaerophilales bacterium]